MECIIESPLAKIAQQLRAARVELAADNRAASFAKRAQVLLVRDTEDGRECPADYFIDLKDERSEDAAKRIARLIAKTFNRHGITRVAVIPSDDRNVSRIVELDDLRNVCFSSEFTSRERAYA